MKVALVYPASPHSVKRFDDDSLLSMVARRLLGFGRTNFTPPLSLLMLAAATPPDVDVRILDERLGQVGCENDVDLVGITVATAAAPRAYEIATEYRNRGVTVVLGGPHPSALPQESLEYGDAVVVGEGEEVWRQVLIDCKRGCLERLYEGAFQSDLDQLPWPRRELIRHPADYLTLKVVTASRGCPNACTFCACGVALGKRYRTRSVENVIAELRTVPGRYVYFADDNLGWDVDYAKELFEALIPLRINWIGSMSLSALQDTELVDLAADSGCMTLALGFESLSADVIRAVRKHRTNDPGQYLNIVSNLHDHGIPVKGNFVLGFDGDDRSTFRKLVDFIDDARIEEPSINLLVPFPGTALYRQYDSEGRLLHKDWSLYDTVGGHVVYRPKQMTPRELVSGYRMVIREVHSLCSTAKRLRLSSRLSPVLALGAFHYNLQMRDAAVSRG